MPPRLPRPLTSLGRLGRVDASAWSSSSSSSSLPSNVQCRQYAGPRTSRSFRRTRKEVEERPGLARPARVTESGLPNVPHIHRPFEESQLQNGAVSPLASSGLLRPVSIQNDPKGILKETDGAMRLLSNSALVIVRQLEMLNVFMGFEQANRYAIMTVQGEHVGYLAEEDQGMLGTMSRQVLRTHRPFRAVVMDREGIPVLWIRRPFALINSRMYVHAQESQTNGSHDSSMIVGEVQQEWHPWRRKYNVFKNREDTYKQFSKIDSGLWAWQFLLKNAQDNVIASIDRNFSGLARELFTDTGQYVIRFDAVQEELGLPITAPMSPDSRSVSQETPRQATDLTLDERAMCLALACNIDIDYFSRMGRGGMGFPMFMWGGGSSELHRDIGTGAAVGTAAGMGDDETAKEAPSDTPPEESWWSQAEASDDVFEDPY